MSKRLRMTACAWMVAVAATSGCALWGSEAGEPPPASPTRAEKAGQPSPPPDPSATTAPVTWASVYADVRTGVVRLDVSSCGDGGTGTGFLLSPTLVATVAHVVEDSTHIRVTSPTQSEVAAGTVVGLDHDHDLALVSLSRPLTGHEFTLSADPPPIGTEIGMIGFPLGRSMQFTTGIITSDHDRREVGSPDGWHAELSNMLLTQAPQNPGNSGGPWLTLDGEVVALAESGPPALHPVSEGSAVERAQGNNAGVPATDASALFDDWTQQPQQVAPPDCDATSSFDEAELASYRTLSAYFHFINKSDYDSAYAQLDPLNHSPTGREHFVDSVKTSQDSAPDGSPDISPLFDLLSLEHELDRTRAEVRFRSRQAAAQGPDGQQTCTDWHLVYEFREQDGVWLIHSSAQAPDDQQKYRACPDE